MGRAGTRWRALLAGAIAGLTLLVAVPTPSRAQDGAPPSSTAPTTEPPAPANEATVPSPVVQGPIPVTNGLRKRILATPLAGLAEHGYVEHELFISGRAGIHAPDGTWGEDGRWSTTTEAMRTYRTRMLVRRPADPAAFNGTVVVSWLDVTGSFDADEEWAAVGESLMRGAGAAYVAVSTQAAGINGPLGAVPWDPTRYGALHLSDDALSYDVFSQAGQALVRPSGVDPLAGLSTERRLIATGRSHAAQRLVTYINAFHPTAQVYDGFLVSSRFPSAASLGRARTARSGLSLAGVLDPDLPPLAEPRTTLLDGLPDAHIRDDLDVPVLVVLTETDVAEAGGERQPDGSRLRTWEVAGAAHLGPTGLGTLLGQLQRDFPLVPLDQLTSCASPSRVPVELALRAAHGALAAWVADGTAAGAAPRIELDGDGEVVRDADGNAVGGLRLPDLAVPTGAHSGTTDADGFCSLVGTSRPFSAADLAQRYPSHQGYVDAVAEAADAAVAAGHLLREDAAQLVAAARRSNIGGTGVTGTSSGTPGTGATDVGRPSGGSATAGAVTGAGPVAPAGAAAPEAAPERRSDRGWMATSGWNLLAPLLGGLLLLANGRVVLTVAQQRRHRRRGEPD